MIFKSKASLNNFKNFMYFPETIIRVVNLFIKHYYLYRSFVFLYLNLDIRLVYYKSIMISNYLFISIGKLLHQTPINFKTNANMLFWLKRRATNHHLVFCYMDKFFNQKSLRLSELIEISHKLIPARNFFLFENNHVSYFQISFLFNTFFNILFFFKNNFFSFQLQIPQIYLNTNSKLTWFINQKAYWKCCLFTVLSNKKYSISYFNTSTRTSFFFWQRDSNLFPAASISNINIFLFYFSFFTNNYYYLHQIRQHHLPIRSKNNSKLLSNILLYNVLKGGKKNLNKFNFSKSLKKKDLTVFQLKPGYSRLWRKYRKAHASITPHKFFRQHRWTKYFLSLSNAGGVSILYQLEFSLFWILMHSYFFFSKFELIFFFLKTLIFINGAPAKQLTMQIFINDVIQFRLNTLVAIFLVNSNYNFLKNKNKFLFKFFKSLNKNLNLLNNWRDKLALFFFDIPNYLEIDFFVCSIIVLYYPVYNFEYQPFITQQTPWSAIKVYNWKYIN